MACLADYLDRAAREPFAWGPHDCVMHFCDWVREATGTDPAERFRGRYQTRLGALRIIRRAGGFLELVAGEMARSGFAETDEPRAGDVGVVSAFTTEGQAPTGAVFDGKRWVVLGPEGLIAAAFKPLKIWRVDCLKQ